MLNKVSTAEVIKGFIIDYTKIRSDFKRLLHDNGFIWAKGWQRQTEHGMEGVWYSPTKRVSMRIRWGVLSPRAILYVEKEIDQSLIDEIIPFFERHDITNGMSPVNYDFDLLNSVEK